MQEFIIRSSDKPSKITVIEQEIYEGKTRVYVLRHGNENAAQQSVHPTAFGDSMLACFGHWLVHLGWKIAKIGGG